MIAVAAAADATDILKWIDKGILKTALICFGVLTSILTRAKAEIRLFKTEVGLLSFG